jgi:hypothetical protein
MQQKPLRKELKKQLPLNKDSGALEPLIETYMRKGKMGAKNNKFYVVHSTDMDLIAVKSKDSIATAKNDD